MPGLVFELNVVVRAVAFALLWWVLAGNDAESWWLGAPAALAAAVISVRLASPQAYRVVPLGLLRFVAYFLLQSLRAAWDVARRALAPRVMVNPTYLRCPYLLPPGLPRIWLAATISLLPGTLTVALEEDGLLIHALSGNQHTRAQLDRLQARIADVFGLVPGPRVHD